MKKNSFLLVFVGSLSFSAVEGQITNIVATQDSAFVVDRVYAGTLVVNDFSVDSIHRRSFMTVRLAASAQLKVSRMVSLISFGAEDVSTEGASIGGAGFFLRVGPQERWGLAIGGGPQVSTFLHRPHPASSAGQFETFTHRSIPVAAPTLRMHRVFGRTTVLGSAASVRGAPEYHLGLSRGRTLLSIWLNGDGSSGGAVTFRSATTRTILVVRNDLVATTVAWTLPQHYVAYVDMGLTVPTTKVVRAETGLLRTFEVKQERVTVQGLVGFGYSYELRALRGYLYITL